MRWDRFFDDLEDQLASEWEAERAALDTEAERLRLSRVTLIERLRALTVRDVEPPVASVELADDTTFRARVTAVGADWVGLEPVDHRVVVVIAPLSAVVGVGLAHVDMLRTARPPGAASSLSDRLTFGFVMRDLVRKRSQVSVHLTSGRVLAGTIDRAGADHLDLAMHEPGAPRRADAITGHRLVPFNAVAGVHVQGGTSFA